MVILPVYAMPAQSPPAPAPPGVIIAHSPASTRQYIGSPSLVRLPSGELIASHDLFGPGCGSNQTRVYASSDGGKSWTLRAEVTPSFWASLFWHRGALYLIGTTGEYGQAVIRRSRDAGRSWTQPSDERSGLLLAEGRYHCAPVPVVVHKGRIWRAFEDAGGPGGWGSHFRAFVMSAPERADLLDASQWRATNRVGRDPALLGGMFGGWLEGNVVVTPEGGLVNILRVDYRAQPEKAAILSISADGGTLIFDPETAFITFPGGCKKFTIRYDRKSGLYWSLANHVPADYARGPAERTRNTVALLCSPDLRRWEIRCILLHHPDTLTHGFQYLDWLIVGEDILAVSRTAYDDGMGGAHNQHDANYLLFHRFLRFRTLTAADGVLPLDR